MSNASFYKWRVKYGGMNASNMKSLRPSKKVVKPSRRKELAQRAVTEKGVSIRLSCQTFGISETCYRYQVKLNDDNALIAD